MKAWILRLLLPLATCQPLLAQADAPASAARVPADPFALPEAPPATPGPGARPSEEAIRAAVRATLDEMPASPMLSGGTALSGAPYREFERKFAFAAKPHCLGPNPLKHQPHSTVVKTPFGAYVVGVGGIYAFPFWAAAIVRGKCTWTP
jgi:hypothetical protein